MNLIDDYLWQLERAAECSALEVQATGTTKRCPACGEDAPIFVFTIPVNQMGIQRRETAPWAHSRVCYVAHELQAKQWFEDNDLELELWPARKTG